MTLSVRRRILVAALGLAVASPAFAQRGGGGRPGGGRGGPPGGGRPAGVPQQARPGGGPITNIGGSPRPGGPVVVNNSRVVVGGPGGYGYPRGGGGYPGYGRPGGYPGYGYGRPGGYGYPGYGFGGSGFSIGIGIGGGYPGYGYSGYRPYGGYGYGGGYRNYGGYGGLGFASVYQPTYVLPVGVPPTAPLVAYAEPAETLPAPAVVNPAPAADYTARGDALVKAGQWAEAVTAYQHASVDHPQDAGLPLKAARALTAAGRYDEAAGAAQQGLGMLPPERWVEAIRGTAVELPSAEVAGAVLANLRAAADAPQAGPGVKFLAGLVGVGRGDTAGAVADLTAAAAAAPQDQVAKKLAEVLNR